ncbi:hypothetical protein HYV73_04390 [Candidatus Uhrbacteria bacterium]|nr:hypothetical protein [Candidatus Uhrbacteria bacterium]
MGSNDGTNEKIELDFSHLVKPETKGEQETAEEEPTERRPSFDRSVCPKGARRIRIFASHYGRHIDERYGRRILLKEGIDSGVIWWPENEPPEDVEVSEDELFQKFGDPDGPDGLRSDVLALGVGGGTLDEHKKHGRTPDVCCADLCARFVKADKKLKYTYALTRIREADTKGGELDPLALPNVVKSVNLYGDTKGMNEALDLFFDAFEEQQKMFAMDCERVIAEKTREGKFVDETFWIPTMRLGERAATLRPYRYIAIEGVENREMGRYLRYRFQVDIVLLTSPKGNMYLTVDQKKKRLIYELALKINLMELERQEAPPELVQAAIDSFSPLKRILKKLKDALRRGPEGQSTTESVEPSQEEQDSEPEPTEADETEGEKTETVSEKTEEEAKGSVEQALERFREAISDPEDPSELFRQNLLGQGVAETDPAVIKAMVAFQAVSRQMANIQVLRINPVTVAANILTEEGFSEEEVAAFVAMVEEMSMTEEGGHDLVGCTDVYCFTKGSMIINGRIKEHRDGRREIEGNPIPLPFATLDRGVREVLGNPNLTVLVM